MNNDVRGSQWRKWDFHVHTPYSALENRYGINPETDATEFDKFVVELLSKAIEKEVCAIGITDYFSVDGYKRIKKEYLENPEKLTELFPDDEMRKKVKKLYLFPNIELRTNDFIGGKHALNYHVIFSGDVPVEDIEKSFLEQLAFTHKPGTRLHINRRDIETHGAEIKKELDEHDSDYKVGLRHIAVAREEIAETLRLGPLGGSYIIAVPVDEDLSSVDWAGRSYSTKREIYAECDCYLTSSPSTRKWALAEGEEEDRIREFGSIKPCIWGSDAHSFDQMFEPSKRRYCWLKCDPTFEGLKQVLYEPGERVAIQPNKPDEKDPHKIIDCFTFTDENFQQVPIFFNENLNCVIGGKSTGKSLLVRSLADAIDHPYAQSQERSSQLSPLPAFCKGEVAWRDGATGKRKIIYIPQTYLNRLVDDSQKQTEINQIIEGVFMQDPIRNAARTGFDEATSACISANRDKIHRYLQLKNEIHELNQELSEDGEPEQFKKVIETRELERKALAAQASVTEAELTRYDELEAERRELQAAISLWHRDLSAVESLSAPEVVFLKYLAIGNTREVVHNFSSLSDVTSGLLQDVIRRETRGVSERWDNEQSTIEASIRTSMHKAEERLKIVQAEVAELQEKVNKTEELKRLAKIIEGEQERLQAANARSAKLAALSNEAAQLQTDIVKSQAVLLDLHQQYCKELNKAPLESTKLQFEAQTVWRLSDFSEYLRSALNNRSFNAFKSETSVDLADLKQIDYNEKFLLRLWESLNSPNEYGGLPLKAGQSFESVLVTIFGNWYNVHYEVRSDGDTIEEMSPGKKSLVLLELLIGLDEEKCPILIDQPEDDLDNRSIYKDLVDYIRKRKHERQIIVVTHNANVVLGSDSEEVIIANQEGIDAKNENARFEYRSGSIENNMPSYSKKGKLKEGVLNRKGIQTQICDILEGGYDALERRRHKYTSTTSIL